MIKRILISLGIIVSAGFGASLPLFPTEKLELLYSYQTTYVDQFKKYEGIASTTNKTLQKIEKPPIFDDTDGNGVVSVSVFRDAVGELHYIQIPDETYLKMTQKGGEVFNPRANKRESLIEMVK